MSDPHNNSTDNNSPATGSGLGESARDLLVPSRRKLLMMGAATASTIVSVKPAMAQAQVSILNCEVPVPGPHVAGRYFDTEGNLVPADTPGAIQPPHRTYTGEQIKDALNGRWLDGAADDTQKRAYLKYIDKLQPGQSGFTCYVSIVNGRR